MRAKVYFWILAIALILAMLFIIFSLVEEGLNWYFIIAEGFIALVLFLLVQLYIRTIKPLNTIGSGMDLLKAQDFSSRLGYVGQKDADKIVEIFNKMMKQLKDERVQLREQNHFLDLLVNSSPMGLIILDIDEKIVTLNPATCKMMGLKECDLEHMLGKKIQEVASHLTKELAKLAKEESSMIHMNDGNIYKCTHASFMNRGFNHTFYLIEKMTEELLKAEKKAYEQVIRMISHEVNNSMAGVSSSIDMIQHSLSDVPSMEEETKEMVELLSIASDRCINLSKFITRFAEVVKIPQPQLSSVFLNDFIKDRMLFIESLASRKQIHFSLELTDIEPKVMIDSILMEQVVLNIIKNAIESVGDRGTISIETSTKPISLTIVDNGEGISEEVAIKLFSPFFSTKPNGQGIGLLLVREILLKHGYKFSLATGEDGLTRFTVFF